MRSVKIRRLMRHHMKLRRSREKDMVGSYTQDEWDSLLYQVGNVCVCCLKSGDDVELYPDHITPVCKEGNNYITNIQPLCKPCNAKKHAKEINYLKEKFPFVTFPIE